MLKTFFAWEEEGLKEKLKENAADADKIDYLLNLIAVMSFWPCLGHAEIANTARAHILFWSTEQMIMWHFTCLGVA